MVPVARFLLRSGVSSREFEDTARLAFIHAAMHDFGLRGRETNTSRISAMTGITRKEVARLRKKSADDIYLDPRESLSPIGGVVKRWATDKAYCDSRGRPKPLSFAGDGVSFSSLVRRSMGDVPLGAVRTELKRLGAISVDEDGALHLRQTHLIPEGFDEKLISAMTYSLRGLAETIAHNSWAEREVGTSRIERYIESRPLTEAEVRELRLTIQERLDEISREIDETLSSSKEQVDGATHRIGVGIYYCE